MSRTAQDERQPSSDAALPRDIMVLTVDDHRGFRDALRDLISATPGFVLVGQACSGEEAIDAVEALAPDLVLMDVVMPGMGGVAATQTILERHPDIAVALISIDDPALIAGAGALGDEVSYLRKQDLLPAQLSHLWGSHGNA
jgi:DNA-binding NarL/FixJ family response regulator